MLAKRLIPCLDVQNGRVVKGVNFVDIKDAGDPVTVSKRYNDDGADEMTLLDITASSDGRETIYHIVEEIARSIFIPLTVGGGVRKIEDIRNLLNAGADKVGLNSIAITNPDLVNDAASRFGAQCVVVSIDAKRVVKADGSVGFEIFTHGGRNATGIDAVAWAMEMAERGAGELLVTSMDGDGTRSGYDLQLIKTISDLVNVPVIASGGAGNLQHLVDGILKGGADAVLAASIFHFGDHTITEAKRFMAEQGICVRL